MWVEHLHLDNIKCFDDTTLRFAKKGQPYRWVTFLSENGGGKSTALQALALLLAGPESAQKLAPRPVAWLRDESKFGLISRFFVTFGADLASWQEALSKQR